MSHDSPRNKPTRQVQQGSGQCLTITRKTNQPVKCSDALMTGGGEMSTLTDPDSEPMFYSSVIFFSKHRQAQEALTAHNPQARAPRNGRRSVGVVGQQQHALGSVGESNGKKHLRSLLFCAK